MTTDYGHSPSIELTLLDSLPDDTNGGRLVVCAWLPMVIWDDIRVVLKSMQGLTLMERFVVECLLTLRQCRAEELLEMAAIPPELAKWLLSSLCQKGLAHQDGLWFRAQDDACIQAMKEKSVPIQREVRRAFIWFPASDEVVVIEDAVRLLKNLRHLHPVRPFPLGRDSEGITGSEIIRNALKNGCLHGDDVSLIVDVIDEVQVDNQMCPAYHCRATVPSDDSGDWSLAIQGYRRRKNRNNSGKVNESTDKGESVDLSLPVPLLPRLVHSWQARLDSSTVAIVRSLSQQTGLTDVSIADGRMRTTVGEHAARHLAKDRLLATFFALKVQFDGEIEFTIPLQVQPLASDHIATSMFTLDNAVRKLLFAPRDAEAVKSACVDAKASMSIIMDRLWELKLFHTVYDLREAEDFSS